jgi:hypothetical protein
MNNEPQKVVRHTENASDITTGRISPATKMRLASNRDRECVAISPPRVRRCGGLLRRSYLGVRRSRLDRRPRVIWNNCRFGAVQRNIRALDVDTAAASRGV